MIGQTTAALFSLLCAYANALPYGSLKTNPITPYDQQATANEGYVYVTITDPNTITYTSTIFSTIISHPAENYSIVTVTKTAVGSPASLPAMSTAADAKDGVDQLNAEQTPKQKSGLQVTATTIYLTKTQSTKQKSSPALVGEYQALNQDTGVAGPKSVKTVMHTIFNTVSAKKRPPPVTKFITVTHTTVKTGEPATILTTVKRVTETITSVTATKTVTSMMKLTTQSDRKRDIILWKRDHPEIEYFEDGSTSTSIFSLVGTMEARAVPTAPQQTDITVTKTYTPSTTVYTTKTITVPGTWVPWANSTTTMTIPATKGGGSEAVEQQINAISVATETVVEPILSTIVPDPPTSVPPLTTSIKTVDVTDVVTVSNHHPSTIIKTKTHVVTLTTIPPSSVVTQMTTMTDSVTISGIYTMFLVQTS